MKNYDRDSYKRFDIPSLVLNMICDSLPEYDFIYISHGSINNDTAMTVKPEQGEFKLMFCKNGDITSITTFSESDLIGYLPEELIDWSDTVARNIRRKLESNI